MRPVWFTDWRQLWHDEAKLLGWLVSDRFDGMRIRMDRRLWKQLDRVRRIDRRLQASLEVRDHTFIRSLVEMLRDEGVL